MGCVQSTSEESSRSREIDSMLEKDRKTERTTVKMLMLGAGESGKSTLVKQMRLMYSTPYSTAERLSYREIVYLNVLQSMQAVLNGFDLVEMPIPRSIADDAYYLSNLPSSAVELVQSSSGSTRAEAEIKDAQLDPLIAKAVMRMWDAQETKQVVAMASKFQLNDSAAYFFQEMPRISQKGYLPTDADILRTRVRSVGISEEHFKVKSYTLKVFDVGGQRSERKKWIHCFESVNILEFVTAISEYDQVLYEDESVNRLQESLVLFDSIACSRWFDRSSLVLLLNKVDLFEAKLAVAPLSQHFPDYKGKDDDLQAACGYMKAKFEALDQGRKTGAGGRPLYVHVTCATDTSQVRIVIAAMMNSILEGLLSQAGLL